MKKKFCKRKNNDESKFQSKPVHENVSIFETILLSKSRLKSLKKMKLKNKVL